MLYLYDTLLYNPLLNVLIFFYNTIAFGDFGLAIIFFTIFVRIILFPLFQKSARHQIVMQRLQPELKKIQEKHRNNREHQGIEMMALYKEKGINPFSGFLFLLVQLPILIALYQIFLNSQSKDFLSGLYGFMFRPDHINTSFVGLINLGGQSILMVGLAALAQYFQGILTLPKAEKHREPTPAEKINRQMIIVAPFITLLIFYNLPAAVSLYWLIATIFSAAQQFMINKQNKREHGQPGIIRQKNN
ncbi:MAG: YidC/Oxa1 family membrane protein insertase [Candidatus Liptonbacteria bacterium]|nr:YidC/Oxa1 family membrane protein insertase [Candidatus Liptonbacteria bacterium]